MHYLHVSFPSCPWPRWIIERGSLNMGHLSYPLLPSRIQGLVSWWAWLVFEERWPLLSLTHPLYVVWCERIHDETWVFSGCIFYISPTLLLWVLAQERFVFWGPCHPACFPPTLANAECPPQELPCLTLHYGSVRPRDIWLQAHLVRFLEHTLVGNAPWKRAKLLKDLEVKEIWIRKPQSRIYQEIGYSELMLEYMPQYTVARHCL